MTKEKSEGVVKPKKTVAAPVGAKPQKSFEGIKIIRVAETDIHGDDKIYYALTQIRGINWSYANAVLKSLGIKNVPVADLSDEQIEKIKDAIANPAKHGIPLWILNRQKDARTGKNYHLLSSDLVFANKMDVEALKQMRCYKGIRHMHNYKVRGQRTRSRGANVRGRVGTTVGVAKQKMMPQKAESK